MASIENRGILKYTLYTFKNSLESAVIDLNLSLIYYQLNKNALIKVFLLAILPSYLIVYLSKCNTL